MYTQLQLSYARVVHLDFRLIENVPPHQRVPLSASLSLLLPFRSSYYTFGGHSSPSRDLTISSSKAIPLSPLFVSKTPDTLT
jgi:hypothetical protein